MSFPNPKFLLPINPGEQVFFVLRKHWVVLAIKIAVWVGLVAALLAGEVIVKTTFPEAVEGSAALLLGLAQDVLLIIFLLGLLVTWTMYYLNAQIVTNERVIDMNQISLLHHETSELNMDKVEDVTAEIKGVVGNFFDFGNVYVQTAGEQREFIFDLVPHPHEVARTILNYYEQKSEADKKNTDAAVPPPKTRNPLGGAGV